MSDLTGLLLLKSDGKMENQGTGFILKIRRQTNSSCPCPLKHDEVTTEHAIVTVSTAYHVFKRSEKNYQITYDQANEIWKSCQRELKLGYNDINRSEDQLLIKFITHDTDTIGRLEGSLSKYQSGLVEAYELSKIYKNDDLVIIVGHPHIWAKRISIGVLADHEGDPKKKVLKEIRGHQTWCQYTYNAVTCNGSSGSPVFKWGQPISGVGFWFGHPHNHSKGIYDYDDCATSFGESTIGVENIV
ncbi:hypothetical protein Btru_002495 [Bulinus truncatus]|nr:hypothetical protein Btru_002495 [Bulinus truncatus]